MLKKGGKKNTNSEYEASTIGDAKIIIGSAFGVFICFLFALLFVYVGINVERKHLGGDYNSEEEVVLDILPVQYETKTVNYKPGIEDHDDVSSYRELLKKVEGEEDYYVIRSNTEYENVLSELALMGGEGDMEPFDLPENFFNSGSIILITKEHSYLTNFEISSLTRNEDYHISINTVSDLNSNNYNVAGIAVMAKIDNIQPRLVEIEDVSENEAE